MSIFLARLRSSTIIKDLQYAKSVLGYACRIYSVDKHCTSGHRTRRARTRTPSDPWFAHRYHWTEQVADRSPYIYTGSLEPHIFYTLTLTRIMITAFVQAALICGSTWFLWNHFRYLVVKTDLDNLSGPSSPSFFFGTLSLSSQFPANRRGIGNTGQLRDGQGWAFHEELAKKYGSVARIWGRFGVCDFPSCC